MKNINYNTILCLISIFFVVVISHIIMVFNVNKYNSLQEWKLEQQYQHRMNIFDQYIGTKNKGNLKNYLKVNN